MTNYMSWITLDVAKDRRDRANAQAAQAKAGIVNDLESQIDALDITRQDFAMRMGVTRAAVRRLLNADNCAMTLLTLVEAAAALGLKVEIRLVADETSPFAHRIDGDRSNLASKITGDSDDNAHTADDADTDTDKLVTEGSLLDF